MRRLVSDVDSREGVTTFVLYFILNRYPLGGVVLQRNQCSLSYRAGVLHLASYLRLQSIVIHILNFIVNVINLPQRKIPQRPLALLVGLQAASSYPS